MAEQQTANENIKHTRGAETPIIRLTDRVAERVRADFPVALDLLKDPRVYIPVILGGLAIIGGIVYFSRSGKSGSPATLLAET